MMSKNTARTAAFRCTTASVRLSTDIPGVVDQARSVLYSYDELPPTEAGCWQVSLVKDPDVADDPHATTSGSREFDIGPDTYAYQHSTGSGNVFWVPARRTVLHADPAARVIRARCASRTAALDWAPRLVRQAMTSQLLTAGMVYTHAAAFTYAGHGVLVAGNRGRGKTTTLLATLHYLGGNYSTNDRLMLHADGETLTGYPWPMPLRAGIGTLTALPHLRHLVPLEQQRLTAPQRWAFTTKTVVDPPDFPTLMQPDASVARHLPVTVTIWPELDPDRTSVSVKRVEAAEVEQTLINTGLFMHDLHRGTSAHTNQWLAPAPPDPVLRTNLEVTAAALAARPCFRVTAGADPAALAAAVGRILERQETP
ncbi:hypothetical protein [Actinoplanes philippinensis]|uniref:hypothetical protein n=1 Tax=Actinoplanes philippinensis TaxID=35752 RepID=UPI0033CF2BBD